MSEIKNYTLNFSCGRAARLTFAAQKLACAEIERCSVTVEQTVTRGNDHV